MFNEKFDNKLRNELAKHTEEIPVHFKQKILDKIEEAENEKMLNNIIWQECFPLIGCVLIGVVTVALTMISPDVIDFLTEMLSGCIVGISEIIKSDYQQCYLWGIYSASLGFVVYCLVDLFVCDN